jgi:arsenate reductase (glutaredoxin)
MVVLYGIKNCDTCKKARNWLEQQNVVFQFHDFRIDGLNESLLQKFIDALGWEALLNKSSTSWRQLTSEQQNDLTAAKAKELMLATPTLIKRPVLDAGGELLLGFKPDVYTARLK